MAVPANTWETYDGLTSGIIREDLADIIYNIAPTETPFQSNVARGSSKGTFHEWTIDTLDTAVDAPVVEGDDAATQAIVPTVRHGNYTQIADKVIRVSGSDGVSDNAGMASRMAYELSKKGMELKRDMETTLVGTNKARAAGSSGTARELAPVLSWISTNTNKDAGGTDPSGDGTDARVDGSTRAFLETHLEDVIDQIFNEGGHPSVIMCGSAQKRVISSSFDGNATKYKEVDDKKVINAVDVYVSDYGELMVVPNRFMRSTDVFVLDTDMWSVDTYRDFQTHDLAKTGDSDRKQMLVEYTLTSKQEAASGGIFDLS
tara:strand:- start:31411 stop:32361 length:951 start_codon:yes stop_codon:yes gene_type:complete